jgi:hypothetical protein
MAFTHKILDESGEEIVIDQFTCVWYADERLRKSTLITPAQAFAYCIDSAVECINASLSAAEPSSPNFGISIFSQFIKRHPYFVTNREPANDLLCNKLQQIANKNSNDRSAIGDFIKIITLFIVPGITQTSIKSGNLVMQDRFDAVNFPESMIPAEYRCTILGQVMSSPYNLTGHFIDTKVIINLRKTHKPNPFTREALPLGPIEADHGLQQKINLLSSKAEWIYATFQANQQYNQKYHDYMHLFTEDLSFAEFCQTIIASPDYNDNTANSANKLPSRKLK